MPQQQQYKGLLDALRRIPQQEGGVKVSLVAAALRGTVPLNVVLSGELKLIVSAKAW
jgi:hypothetical protein